MPRGRTIPQPEIRIEEPPAQNGRHDVSTETRPEPVVRDKPHKAKRSITWPKLSNLFKRRTATADKDTNSNGHVDAPVDAVIPPTGNGTAATPEVPKTSVPKRRSIRKKRASPRKFIQLLRKPSAPKKPKRVRYTRSARAVKYALAGLILFLGFGAVRGISAGPLVKEEATVRKAADTRTDAQLKNLGASSTFPLSDAIATAQRMAYECFTVPNFGVRSTDNDLVGVQNRALRDAGIAAGDNVICGWNGKGRGQVVNTQVVSDPYWVQSNRATIVLQLKLYQRPGFLYYYVPFVNSNGVAKVAGMPAIFGVHSGALSFLSGCNTPDDTVDTEKLSETAQLFVNALAGDTSIPLGYIVYENAKFGGFGPMVSSPKISQVMYCGSHGEERLFAALVTFKGPIKGSHYSLPYAFGVVPNSQTNGKYQVKEFGPAPSYTGS
jgi:hypothetical protein